MEGKDESTEPCVTSSTVKTKFERMTEVEPYESPSSKQLNVNRYATKKTIAQGMLDIALLTANASQLKYVLQAGNRHPFYHLMLTLISISIVLQVTAGICMLFLGSLNMNKPKNQSMANILNNVVTIKIFIISVLNVLISSFGIEHVVQEDARIATKQAQLKAMESNIVTHTLPRISSVGKVSFDEDRI